MWPRIRFAFVVLLAGFLIVYHAMKLKMAYLSGADSAALSMIAHGQNGLRALIILALLLVIARVRGALWVMWIGIGLLIASQIFAYFDGLLGEAANAAVYLGYLKGFILPTLITFVTVLGSRSKPDAANA